MKPLLNKEEAIKLIEEERQFVNKHSTGNYADGMRDILEHLEKCINRNYN